VSRIWSKGQIDGREWAGDESPTWMACGDVVWLSCEAYINERDVMFSMEYFRLYQGKENQSDARLVVFMGSLPTGAALGFVLRHGYRCTILWAIGTGMWWSCRM
jgi:hypothetical protein